MDDSHIWAAAFCAQNIALLSLLHRVVEPQQANSPVEDSQKTRQLSLQQERDLSRTLAFLAGISADPNHIMALCVQEEASHTGLRILVAINKAGPESGTKVLDTVARGFRDIFGILANISRDQNLRLEDEVFSAIISLCQDRILVRMRSSKGNLPFRHKSRPFLGLVLKQAVDKIVGILRQRDTSHTITCGRIFVEESHRLIHILQELEGGDHTAQQLHELVRDSVLEINRLTKAANLPEALSIIPNGDIEPSARQRLITHTKKIARYWEAARFLSRSARSLAIFQQATITTVQLGSSLFESPRDPKQPPNFSSSLSRVFNARGPSKNVGQICGKLGKTKMEVDACFEDIFRRAMRKSKIHAEVQLVLHYELNTASLPPRVISSSKDACYLCNSFVKFHGKYHIPRSHGRLYHAWRLPKCDALPELQVGFNAVLDERIRLSTRTLLSKGGIPCYPDPNESTISSLAMSDSTVRPPAGSRVPTLPPTADPSIQSESHVENDTVQQGIELEPSSDESSDMSSGSTSGVAMIQGRCFSDRVHANRPPLLYSANGLELFFEHGGSFPVTPTTQRQRRCPFTVEWLDEEEAQRFRAERPSGILNASSLSTAEDLTIPVREAIYIELGSSIIRIRREEQPRNQLPE